MCAHPPVCKELLLRQNKGGAYGRIEPEVAVAEGSSLVDQSMLGEMGVIDVSLLRKTISWRYYHVALQLCACYPDGSWHNRVSHSWQALGNELRKCSHKPGAVPPFLF